MTNVAGRAAIIGLATAVIDNVPLVAATMGMYDTATYPVDSQLWQLIAYCAVSYTELHGVTRSYKELHGVIRSDKELHRVIRSDTE